MDQHGRYIQQGSDINLAVTIKQQIILNFLAHVTLEKR